MLLDPRALEQNTHLAHHDSVGSTNIEAFAAARSGAAAPLWVVAAEQTAGKGRRGRAWRSPPGNLYASLLLIAPSPPQKAAQLSFVSALALADAVAAVAPLAAPKLRVKWPNDVLLDGAKISGILIEGEDIPGRGQAVVIGCGINCVDHPADTPYKAADLSAYGVSREAVFAALSGAMADRLAQWARGERFDRVRSDWLDRAAGVGMPIRVRTGEREIEGLFGAIDAEGGLVLGMPDGGAQVISAGEIVRLGATGSAV